MARAAEAPQVMAALSSFDGSVDGIVLRVRAGDLFASSDPAVKKWPTMFGPVTIRETSPRVEQATAAPGEKRGA
jgi:hypothetical protein